MVRRGRRPRQVEEVEPAPEEAAARVRSPAARGAAAGSPGGSGDACPCAEAAADPRSATEAIWRAGGILADGVKKDK
jgi:hypothetical protein